jgi:hypothetical protein
LIGECHINFEKLMENILNINQNDGSAQKNLGKSIEREFDEKLWYCGHSVGNVKGKLLIENMPFIN